MLWKYLHAFFIINSSTVAAANDWPVAAVDSDLNLPPVHFRLFLRLQIEFVLLIKIAEFALQR